MVKKIGVVTATRAEYGLLTPLLSQLNRCEEFELQLFVTGSHLSHEFGFTKDQIIKDGFEICEEIDCVVSNDTPSAIGKTAGLALMGLSDAFFRHKPDLVVLLGDRYEILCAAIAANFCRIPIAHLHGGEITEGAYDDGFRHAITKLSHIHFTATDKYRNRVLQLGENSDYVFNVGAIGLDNIKSVKPLSKSELEEDLGIKFKKNNLLVTIHSETLEPGSSEKNINILLKSLEKLKNTFIIFTGTNADSEGRIINKKLKGYAAQSDFSFFIENLGQLRYLSILNIVDAVVGNSSSGIIEVPSFNIPTINIGNRQKGRMRAKSVIDVFWDSNEIYNSIIYAFSNKLGPIENPFGNGNTANCIAEILMKVSITKNVLKKKFIDIIEGGEM